MSKLSILTENTISASTKSLNQTICLHEKLLSKKRRINLGFFNAFKAWMNAFCSINASNKTIEKLKKSHETAANEKSKI